MAIDFKAPSTIGDHGTRVKLYPTEVKGFFTKYRTLVGWFLLVFYLVLPWLKIGDTIIFRLDAIERKLILFGTMYWPGDIAKFLPAIIATVFAVFAVTAIFGRVWCGWACPQTVFLQFVFGPIETLIEGKAFVRRRRDQKGMTWDLLWRKILKHLMYLLFSALIANSFLMYFVGPQKVLSYIVHSPQDNITAFFICLSVWGVFYWIFAFFKEQACVLVCPYAKLQSVLTDSSSLQVTYDVDRGEPRLPKTKVSANEAFGDCVSCSQCVKVCPTGIDIRDGLQLECIGCTRCIDACDKIMDIKKRPRGLIRYTSEEKLKNAKATILKSRFYIYLFLVVTLYSITAVLLWTNTEEQIDLTRKGGLPYLALGPDTTINFYHLRLRNKGQEIQHYSISIIEPNRFHSQQGQKIEVLPQELKTIPITFKAPNNAFTNGQAELTLVVDNGHKQQRVQTIIIGP